MAFTFFDGAASWKWGVAERLTALRPGAYEIHLSHSESYSIKHKSIFKNIEPETLDRRGFILFVLLHGFCIQLHRYLQPLTDVHWCPNWKKETTLNLLMLGKIGTARFWNLSRPPKKKIATVSAWNLKPWTIWISSRQISKPQHPEDVDTSPNPWVGYATTKHVDLVSLCEAISLSNHYPNHLMPVLVQLHLKRLSRWPLASLSSLQVRFPGNRADPKELLVWDLPSLNFI